MIGRRASGVGRRASGVGRRASGGGWRAQPLQPAGSEGLQLQTQSPAIRASQFSRSARNSSLVTRISESSTPPSGNVHRSRTRVTSSSFAAEVWSQAGQFRRRFCDPDELPEPLAKLAELGDRNIQFVPKTRSKYFEYATLLQLLPASTLER